MTGNDSNDSPLTRKMASAADPKLRWGRPKLALKRSEMIGCCFSFVLVESKLQKPLNKRQMHALFIIFTTHRLHVTHISGNLT